MRAIDCAGPALAAGMVRSGAGDLLEADISWSARKEIHAQHNDLTGSSAKLTLEFQSRMN